jgi:hypothetical protein
VGKSFAEAGRWHLPALPPLTLTSTFPFFRALKFPGLFCDFRGLERDGAGESITE